jgi:hypothetical protein
VVGIQACFGSGHEAEVVPGLRFFDVTHPRHPVLLAHWDLPQGTIGCHEIDAVQRADNRLLAVCARNLIDHLNTNGAVAIHLVDVTDPASPQAILDWSLGLDPNGGVGCLPFQFAHSARFEDRGNSARRRRRQPLDDPCQGGSVAGDQSGGLLSQRLPG